MKSISELPNLFLHINTKYKLWLIAGVILLNFSLNESREDNYYPRAVTCPTEPSIKGYKNLDDLKRDIYSHYQASLTDGSSRIIKYKYILCPDTIYRIESPFQTIMPFSDENSFSCGVDGLIENNCIIEGGDYQVYFLDRFTLKNVVFQGFTFTKAKIASVYGNAHPDSLAIFDDCVWKNMNDALDVAYIHHTTSDRSRRLNGGRGKYDFERLADEQTFDAVLQKYEKEHKKSNSRELQIDSRFAMGVIFSKCTFKNISNKDSVIFSSGGDVTVVDSIFEENIVEKFAIFTTIFNGHVSLSGTTTFVNNQAPLGPVFVSSDSFLQYSEGATGHSNSRGVCGSIFIEDDGARCLVSDESKENCSGKCCEFDDITCDFRPDPTASPTASPTPNPTSHPSRTPTSNPTTNPTSNPTPAPTSKHSLNPTSRFSSEPTMNPTFSPTHRPSTNPTISPTFHPSSNPTIYSSSNPTLYPSSNPTIHPSSNPTLYPSSNPTLYPSSNPTIFPTSSPEASIVIVGQIQSVYSGDVMDNDGASRPEDDSSRCNTICLVSSIGVPLVVMALVCTVTYTFLREKKRRRYSDEESDEDMKVW